MQTRLLTGTDLNWSRLGMGCWAIGGEYWGLDVNDTDAIAAIHAALELGINWFDTAPLYGKGHADSLLAKALAGTDAAIATKVGVRWDGEHAVSDLSPDHLRADVDASLKRLGREQIELLQVHWPCNQGTPIEDSFLALHDIVKSGKVRYLGVCNYDTAALKAICEITPIVSLQTPYSMLRREFEQTLRPTCKELDLSTLAYEPLGRGLLSGKYRQPPVFPSSDLRSRDDRFSGSAFVHIQRLVADLGRVARRLDVPMVALALGWALQRSDFVLVGVKRPSQIIENARFEAVLDRAAVWSVVDKILAIHGGVRRA